MTDYERFGRDARSRGVLIDTNLLVLLIVGLVNRDRIPQFKRTSHFSAKDWNVLAAMLDHIPRRYCVAHILAEVSTLTDMPGPERFLARGVLHRTISGLEEVPIASLDACKSPYYRRLGLTDAAIVLIAQQRGCSVVTNDSALYLALMEEGASAINFDDLRNLL